LSLKGICSQEEWDQFKEDIYYDYKKDNNFTELREAELLRERITTLQLLDPYIGKYFSQTWAKKNVLRMSEDEIEQMDKEMEEDGSLDMAAAPESGVETNVENVDNTVERLPAESPTPQLDSEVEKYSVGINR
jgi:PHP family Zn ribbon phosphoesterase